MQETWVQSLGQEDPLGEEMATHSNILAWEIPWSKEPGGLEFMGSQRDRTQLNNKHTTVNGVRLQKPCSRTRAGTTTFLKGSTAVQSVLFLAKKTLPVLGPPAPA